MHGRFEVITEEHAKRLLRFGSFVKLFRHLILCVLRAGVYPPNQELWHEELTTSSWSFRLLFIVMRKTLLHAAVLVILAGMLGGQIDK